MRRCIVALLLLASSASHAANPSAASGGTSNLPKFDLDADGKADLILIRNDAQVDRRQLLLSNGTALLPSCQGLGCEGTTDNDFGIDSEAYMRDPNTRVLTGDFNGDQKSDLLVISGDPNFTRRMLLLSNGTTLVAACVSEQDGGCGFDTEPYMFDPLTRFLPGDFNGDGKTDVLVISGANDFPRRQLLLSTGSGFIEACVGNSDGACGIDTKAYMFLKRTQLLTGDFNGDSRTDVLVISGDSGFSRRMLLLSTGATFSVACVGELDGACGFDNEPYMFAVDTKLIAGDFNGDSRTDVLVVSGDPNFSRRTLLTSTGSGFIEACVGNQDGACGFDTEPYMFHANTRLIPGDFAGDSKTDILVISGDNTFSRRALLAATGSGFSEVCVGQQDGACGIDTEPYMFNHLTRELVGNFDGLGKDDLLVLSGDNAFPRRYLLLSNAAGFVDGCASQTASPCGVHADFMNSPTETSELPRQNHNRPVHQRASTFKAEPDITRSLDWAARNGAELIELDGPSGTIYESGKILLRSQQTLSWGPGITLLAKLGAFPALMDSFITIQNVAQVRLKGSAGAKLKMRKSDYLDGEWRHGVNILSAHGVSVENLEIRETGGDGVYISDSGNRTKPSTQILLSNIVCDLNSRNGLSVINVDGLEVANSTFSNTKSLYPGTVANNGPFAGIDFEPNYKDQQLRNISVHDVILRDNKSYGVLFALGNFQAPDTDSTFYSLPVTIDLTRVSITGAVPNKAVTLFNYQAMSRIPAGSSIRLTNLDISVGPTNGDSLTQSISGVDYGVVTNNTCGFGVRPGKGYVCKRDANGTFLPPTKFVDSWLDNFFVN